ELALTAAVASAPAPLSAQVLSSLYRAQNQPGETASYLSGGCPALPPGRVFPGLFRQSQTHPGCPAGPGGGPCRWQTGADDTAARRNWPARPALPGHEADAAGPGPVARGFQ